VILNAHNPRR